MNFQLKYVNVFDDINKSNIDKIQQFYNQANLKVPDIPMPNFDESSEINSMLASTQLSPSKIADILTGYCGLTIEVARELSVNMLNEIRLIVPSDQAVKSTFAKVVYWFKSVFNSVANNHDDNIYISAKLNKHSLYVVYLLSKLGNNIVIIDTSFNKKNYQLYNNFKFNCEGTSERLKILSRRTIKSGELNELLGDNSRGYGASILLIGEDNNNELNNKLCGLLDTELADTLILTDGIERPSYGEVSAIRVKSAMTITELRSNLSRSILICGKNSEYVDSAYKFIINMISNETNASKAVSKVTTFASFFRRYNLGVKRIISYGKLDKHSVRFLSYVTSLNKEVIVIDTSGRSVDLVDESWEVISIGEEKENHPYPTTMHSNSLAYSASKEMDQLLYNGNTPGLYRNRQYKTCNITKLNTTFDEMLLLWNQDNVVRPGFNSSENGVIVPVIYSKVLGVNDSYNEMLSKLAGEHTIIYYTVQDMLTDIGSGMEIVNNIDVGETNANLRKPIVGNSGINLDVVLGYSNFTYKHLDEGVQLHILSKLDDIIKSGNTYGLRQRAFIDKVLNVGLNLGRRITQEMQWYDYTKQSPKVVLLCQSEDMLGIEQSILISLLHLCGWDIAIMIPTHYNVIGEYIDNRFIQEHIIGEPKFNSNITEVKPYVEKKNFFKRIFN